MWSYVNVKTCLKLVNSTGLPKIYYTVIMYRFAYIRYEMVSSLNYLIFDMTYFQICFLNIKSSGLTRYQTINGYKHQVHTSHNSDTLLSDWWNLILSPLGLTLQIQNYIDHNSHLGHSFFLNAKINNILYLITCSKKSSDK
jgi:hypothetical protein